MTNTKALQQQQTTISALHRHPWVTAGQHFAVSASAAWLAHLLHHPLYTLKSQMMFHGPRFRFKTFFRSSANEPVRFLYRGLAARLVGIMPEKAMKMQAWTTVGRYMERNYENLTYTKWIIAGAAAGAATTLIGCPSERIMVLAQIQKQGVIAVMRSAGLNGLYHGWTATLYRDIVFNTTFFSLRELFVLKYEEKIGEDPQAFVRVALGLPAGCIASVVGCPHDVIKTRMQGKKVGSNYQSCLQIFTDIVKNEGPRHLMKGLVPRLIVVPSFMSVFYVINEELEKLFLR